MSWGSVAKNDLNVESNSWIDSIASLRQNIHWHRVETDSSSHNSRCAEGRLIVDMHDAPYTIVAVLKIMFIVSIVEQSHYY